MEKKINIRELELSQLGDKLVDLGEKKFRAKQVYHWLWQKNVGSFEEMTNLSMDLRDKLENTFVKYKLHGSVAPTDAPSPIISLATTCMDTSM